jgi:hypothetical protein
MIPHKNNHTTINDFTNNEMFPNNNEMISQQLKTVKAMMSDSDNER